MVAELKAADSRPYTLANIHNILSKTPIEVYNYIFLIYTKTKYIWWKVTAPDIVYNTKLVHSS